MWDTYAGTSISYKHVETRPEKRCSTLDRRRQLKKLTSLSKNKECRPRFSTLLCTWSNNKTLSSIACRFFVNIYIYSSTTFFVPTTGTKIPHHPRTPVPPHSYKHGTRRTGRKRASPALNTPSPPMRSSSPTKHAVFRSLHSRFHPLVLCNIQDYLSGS